MRPHTMSTHRVTLTIPPTELERIFNRPTIIYEGKTRDPVAAACNCYMLWRSEHPHSRDVQFSVDGLPHESATLTRALFRRPRKAS